MYRPLCRSELKRLSVLSFTAAIVTIIVYSQAPIAQDLSYHLFSDTKSVFGIPNFWNVISNTPFFFVGLAGIYSVLNEKKTEGQLHSQEKSAWLLLFSGIFLTGFGSGWYHLNPDNNSLVWDRLPMSIAFMGLFAGIIAERISHQAYKLLLWPLVGIGVASVISWYTSELRGTGDLRMYVIVQFLPLLTIPLMMAVYSPKYTHSNYVVFALILYGLAKGLEHFDAEIFVMTGGIMGGHALKHLFAATGCYFLAVMIKIRRILGENEKIPGRA